MTTKRRFTTCYKIESQESEHNLNKMLETDEEISRVLSNFKFINTKESKKNTLPIHIQKI